MARKPIRTLDEQLIDAKEELKIAEERVVNCKEKIKNIEKQIEEKVMLDAYQLLKDNKISLGELEVMICGKQNKTA